MTEILERLKVVNEKLDEQVVIDPQTFAQIVDGLPDGLLVINENGIIQLVNQQIELLFGYPRGRLIGEPVHMLLAPAMAETHARHIAKFFSQPSSRPMNLGKTLPGQHSSGRAVMVQISLSPIISNQGVLALGVVRRVNLDGHQSTG
jgi:PAS domain S-box-containing protein